MVSLPTWLRYVFQKIDYSFNLSYQNYKCGRITNKELSKTMWKYLLFGKLTYIEKAQKLPALGEKFQTSLIRKIPIANPWHVAVGDTVVYKDPEGEDRHMVGRLDATEGYEMASTDEKDEPFILDKDQCWIVAGDKKAKDAKDSRTYGPISTTNIVGRVIYRLENAVDHVVVENSHVSMKKDLPVLEVELDVDEMVKIHESKTE